MGITGQADGQASATGTRGGKYWTRTTLANHLVGLLPMARNASGGSVPDRLDDIINETFAWLWECHPWEWRRTTTTLTTAANDQTLTLPADYHYLDQLTLIETSDNGGIKVTTDLGEFNANRQANTTDGVVDTGQPEIAFCEVDQTASEFRRLLRIIPAADGVYSYLAAYFKLAPAMGPNDVPMWPSFMFRVWKSLSQAIAQHDFDPNDEKWKSTYGFAKSQLDAAKNDNDKNLDTQAPEIRPGLDDFAAAMGIKVRSRFIKKSNSRTNRLQKRKTQRNNRAHSLSARKLVIASFPYAALIHIP